MDAQDQVEKFKDFIESVYLEKLHEVVRKGESSLIIDFKELVQFAPELADDLLEKPGDALRSIELSLDSFDLQEAGIIKIRFRNLTDSQKILIKDIRASSLSKLVAIDGIVRQASEVRPQVVSAKFECPSCGNTITIPQLESKFKEPTKCSCGRQGRFHLVHKVLVDSQRLVIEEIPEYLEGGEQPKRLAVYAKEDLVDPKMEKRATPGSKIRVVGVIQEIPIVAHGGGQLVRFDIVVEANHIEPLEETFFDLELSKKDVEEINNLAKDPKIYEKFAQSIAPSIYGHEKVKEAIVLQLMGGVKKLKDDGTTIRGDMHVLLVGDPGAAKSTMLNFVSKAAPKARFVSGKSVTGAGLTSTVVRDEFIRGWALEAGALVLANGGICCIDELDKMTPEDRAAMHEALEQQRISVAKANIQATLRAETTVLAAANPKLGRFDPYDPIAKQIDLPPTLLNRFDLIFAIRDIPNKKMDEKIATHVLNLQKNPEKARSAIPVDVLRKYIAYVKQKIKPKLTEDAIKEIKEFYVNLRNSEQQGEEGLRPIPISARQLEALVRLAEGSARIRLSEEVTKEDARRAIDLLEYSLRQVGVDPETGKIDIDRISTGISASQRGKIVTVREIIHELEKKIGATIPVKDVISEAISKGIKEDQVEDALEKLKRSGDIFEPRAGFLQRL
ncbi:MAG: minichromosome maintenance protein MCM [Candidatus Woesearchaeota archaeon]|nr:MAG: minichromosome maintenance protein MCM [Candidatus Woesearchaeota archaeon]